ncbi:unnamed protein product, partial [Candidula unifasciata]
RCDLSCSPYCINKCDSANGSCTCRYNRTGKNCAGRNGLVSLCIVYCCLRVGAAAEQTILYLNTY